MRRPRKHNDLTVLELTGDADALTYGGGVVFRKEGDTFWQFWDQPTSKTFVVWTTRIGVNILRDYKSVARAEISSATGLPVDTLRTMSTSSRVMDRLTLIQAVSQLEGRSRICPTGPEELTTYEMAQRWGEVFEVDPSSYPKFDKEDYVISEFEEGMACGQVAGRFLGLYETFECCAAAIAEDIEASGVVANVYIEEDGGEMEKLEWSRGRWLGRSPVPIRMGFAKATWRYRMRPYSREAAKKGRRLDRAERAVKRPIRGTLRKSRT